jgi:hypothetical protein
LRSGPEGGGARQSQPRGATVGIQYILKETGAAVQGTGRRSATLACAACHTVLVSPFAMSRVEQFLAYADPGSGLLIWQGLLAAFFGSLFYLRRILRRLKKGANTRAEERGERGDGAGSG